MPALSQNLIFHQTSGTNSVSISHTGTSTTFYYSDQVKGDGYFGGSDGVHTAAYKTNLSFVGTVTMQATLASAPVSSDWFTVSNTNVSYASIVVRTTSTINLINFTGNFVWVRGCIQITAGSVLSIQYNH
jgi:hypothetical protein